MDLGEGYLSRPPCGNLGVRPWRPLLRPCTVRTTQVCTLKQRQLGDLPPTTEDTRWVDAGSEHAQSNSPLNLELRRTPSSGRNIHPYIHTFPPTSYSLPAVQLFILYKANTQQHVYEIAPDWCLSCKIGENALLDVSFFYLTQTHFSKSPPVSQLV